MADAGIDYLEQWALLAVRRLQPNANAVSIREEIEKQTGRTPHNIYVPLYTLRKKGFIKNSPLHEITTTGRVRKQPIIVHLTERGRHTLEEWLRAIDSLRRGLAKKSARK
jgi:DNA-binding PadR family transcriptional regulator